MMSCWGKALSVYMVVARNIHTMAHIFCPRLLLKCSLTLSKDYLQLPRPPFCRLPISPIASPVELPTPQTCPNSGQPDTFKGFVIETYEDVSFGCQWYRNTQLAPETQLSKAGENDKSKAEEGLENSVLPSMLYYTGLYYTILYYTILCYIVPFDIM